MTTTRTRLTSSGLIRVASGVLLLIGSACEPAPKVVPSGDVSFAQPIAHSTAAVLLSDDVAMPTFASFEEFYPYYVGAHSKAATRCGASSFAAT